MSTRPPLLHFLIYDKRWKTLPGDSRKNVLRALGKAAEILAQDFSAQEVTIVLSNNVEIQALNKEFRHSDKPTNVLSFPSGEPESLGDIILAFETIVKEAENAQIPLPHHILHLIIHGFLHLLGYDHEKEEEALSMEGLEIQILHTLSIPNPYEEK